MHLTQKIRISPSPEQEKILWILSNRCRLLYNFALQERRENWIQEQSKPKNKRRYILYFEQSANLPLIKSTYPEYKWVHSKVLQQTIKKLDENFKSFFSLIKSDMSVKPPNFKSKRYFFTLCYNQKGFKLLSNSVKFSHKHPSKIPLVFDLMYKYQGTEKIKQIEITYNKKKWFICITYQLEPPIFQDNGLYQAIDLGISDIVSAVNLDFKFLKIKNRRADLYWKEKIAHVQSKRDHCKKESHRWIRYNSAYKRICRKLANQMRDYQHKISKQIVNNTKANTIVIGDLNVKEMAKRNKSTGNKRNTNCTKTLNHSVYNTGSLSRFSQFLTYKAELLGKKVIRIDESNTTKKCCLCGTIRKRGLGERKIICDCGNRMDRDNNSAVNIMERFLTSKKNYSFLSLQPSMKEVSFRYRLDMLRKTALSSSYKMRDSGLVVMGNQ